VDIGKLPGSVVNFKANPVNGKETLSHIGNGTIANNNAHV